MAKYNLEFELSKEDTPLIKKEGSFTFSVDVIGEVVGEISKGYINKFGGQEEPDSDDREIAIHAIHYDIDDYLLFCEEVGCDDVGALMSYIDNLDYADNEKVKNHFFKL